MILSRTCFALLLWGALLPINAHAAFVHPGVPFTAADLDELKSHLGAEPWKSAYASLAADEHSQLNYKMQGPFASVSRVPNSNRKPWINDMQAIHHLTFMWVFTHEEAYAKKASEMLDAWATTNTSWGGDEAILDLGDWVQYYATAADILKSTYPGWTAANTAHVNNYFANVLWPQLDVPNPVRGANQGADAIKAAMGIAVFLDDTTKFHQALASLRGDPAAGLANTLSNGQVGDSGRDEGHTAGQIWNLAWSAEVAWKQGVDVFADLDNRLRTVEELYARYNLNPSGVTYLPFGNPYELYVKGFGWTKGARRVTPSYNIIEGAYALRKGIATPYTVQLRNMVGENKETFLFRKTADKSTATPLPPIVHPSAVAVTRLSHADVGKVGLAGSSVNNGGTWTIRGAGSIPVPAQALPSGPATTDAFQFAYQQITGDAVIIARVTSMSSMDPEARAGVMLRESLEDDARHVGIFISPTLGARTTWRHATAWTKTDTSWLLRAPGGYEEHAAAKPPYWVKLERLGTRVTVYNSFDGVTWCCPENVETPIPSSAYLGLCVSSHDPAALNSSSFTNVAMTSTASPGN